MVGCNPSHCLLLWFPQFTKAALSIAEEERESWILCLLYACSLRVSLFVYYLGSSPIGDVNWTSFCDCDIAWSRSQFVSYITGIPLHLILILNLVFKYSYFL